MVTYFSLDMYNDYGQEAQDMPDTDGTSALNLQWVMGFNKDID